MINENLTKEEFDLIFNYRKGKYALDITQEEYDLIISKRNSNIKIYEKYIENIEILTKDKNTIVSTYAAKLLVESYKLREGNITFDDYKNVEDFFSPIND